MAFRKKNALILKEAPDILVIPECENEKNLRFGKLTPLPNDFLWHGEDESKGIGIFSYADYKLFLLEQHTPRFRYIVPIRVSGKNSFTLLAVWAMNESKENYKQRYIGQLWRGLQYYADLLGDDTIIVGDFNWNKIWDRSKGLAGNLTDMVGLLKEHDIISVYHAINREDFGKESSPTFYLHRRFEKRYHIDYCFSSIKYFSRLESFRIGRFSDWIEYSDHMPMMITFNDLS